MSTTLSTIVSSDERLWRAVIAGDTMAFQKVVERYQGSVSGVAYNVVGEFAASQDVAQETFWAAWKSRTQLREPQRLGGWLCGIARNLANEWQRKHRRDRSAVETGSAFEPISPALDPIEQSISNEEEAMVWNSLEEIGENYREVMVLFYRQGQSVAEVAAALELSEDAVKQRSAEAGTCSANKSQRKSKAFWFEVGPADRLLPTSWPGSPELRHQWLRVARHLPPH